MADPSSQRAYRAACPGCGAPLAFASAQSAFAVCGYCSSTVARQGDVLKRIGKMAELFDDFSPLQLQASGTYKGIGFRLIGRLQYAYGEGRWTEWLALLDDGSQGSLSEDNGAYVFSKPASISREVPAAEVFRVGMSTAIGGKRYSVASNEQVSLISAQGELPKLPPLGQPFAVVDLRSADDEVLSIDYLAKPPQVSLGQAVLLDDLKLSGLREESAKDEKGRQFSCPNCGAPVLPVLAQSKSITCQSCHSLIDMQAGIGGELRHAEQGEPVQLLIPLGSSGTLQGKQWQVVGFQHRMGRETGQVYEGDDNPTAVYDEEHFGWSEYLLYNLGMGFYFLVDAEDGWSLVRPITGAPEWKEGQSQVAYQKDSYKLQSSYHAETNYVAGEFYWQVVRGQKTYNCDFASGSKLLSREQGGREVTWSRGYKLNSDLVAQTFGLSGKQEAFKRADASPLSSAAGLNWKTILLVIVVLVVLSLLLARCSKKCDPEIEECSSASRSSGGAYGGFIGGSSGSSSGGSHK